MYSKHISIIVTGDSYVAVSSAREKAEVIFSKTFSYYSIISNIVGGTHHDVFSFFIAPDGLDYVSSYADIALQCREEFIEYLKTTKLEFVEVIFGGDDDLCIVTDKNKFKE